jgi:Zn-finger nucleic acid-binding protein
MKCPVNKKDMIVVEHRKIELDYCLDCQGVWFDSNELELLIDTLKKAGARITDDALLTPQAASVAEKPRQCPICGKNMDKVWMGKTPRVLIDHCPRGHGLWFDGGELHQVIGQLGGAVQSGSPDVLSFLGDTFKANPTK